ncbi:MAG: NADH-quinone oxidoreductase subunit N [Actinomycetota bacterium]
MGLNLPEVELLGIAPEIALVTGALIILILDAMLGERENRWHLWVLSTITLGVSIFFAVQAWGTTELHLGDMIAVDGFATFVKITLAVFALLTVWLSRSYLRRDGIEESEFYGLLLFSVAGMMLMASAADLIMVFLALETFSLALYVLVGFRRTSLTGQESAMKYFLLGAFSSAFFLLGIAFVYGAVGSTQLYGSSAAGASAQGISTALVALPAGELTLLVIATGLIVVGLGFKVAAVPFHMWTPDAYQGAPSPVTGFMAAGSKLAGFAALLRLLDAVLFPLRADWRPLVIAVAVITMIVGSVLAVVQEDLKRLLAYSSIAHAGFVFTGIIATNDRGVSGSLFYLATYGITVLGAFAVVSLLSGRDEKRTKVDDFRGLFYDSPLLAGALTLFLLSLAGVPATSGFVGKLVVFGAAVEEGYSWVVVVGVLASAIAAFFYLRVLVVMYMQEKDEGAEVVGTERFGGLAKGVVGVAALATVALGLYWSPLIDLAQRATFFFASGG